MTIQNLSKPGKVLIAFILIASVLLLLNVFQFFQSDFVSVKKKELKSENVQLEKAVNSAKQEINKYKGISQKLDKVVKEGIVKINDQENKILQLLTTGKNLKKENLALANEINEMK